jgi:hypothetical protein
MPRILTPCPNTGTLVSTGQRTPAFDLSTMGDGHAFRCSACGKPHRWRAEDAVVESATLTLAALRSAA